MRLHRALRSLPRLLPLLALLLAAPHAALGQAAAPAAKQLAPDARARLAQAAGDARFAPWQRDLMLRLARTGAATMPGSAVAGPRNPQPASVSDTADGAWSDLTIIPAPTAALPRFFSSAIYDPVRDRMLVFGGYTGSSYLNDVWALSLAGTPSWTLLAPAGTPPAGRFAHTAVYDPVRDRMLVFGGISSAYVLNDVWALSLSGTPAWEQLAPTGPTPDARKDQSAIYDPAIDCMIMFGGDSVLGIFNDVWALSLSGTPAWIPLAPSGTPPSARQDQSAIYDPARNSMVVFGGYDGTNVLSEVWEVTLTATPAWTQLTPAGTPPAGRGNHGAFYDPVRDRMVVFGGYTGSALFNDVWELSLTDAPAWVQVAPSGTLPVERCGQGTIYDPVRDRMVVFGGFSVASMLGDTWQLALRDTAAWTLLDTSPIAGRDFCSAIYDSAGARAVVFGGSTGTGELSDAWARPLTGAAWERLAPAGTPPSARSRHSAVYDPLRDRMLVFGGYTSASPHYLNDVWALSLSGAPAWTQLAPGGTPPAIRNLHSAIYDPLRDRMVVYGGSADSSYFNDVWALSLAGDPAWSELTPAATGPAAGVPHGAVYDRAGDRLVVFGASEGSGFIDDVWALPLAGTPAWTQLAPAGARPPARRFHSTIQDPVRDRVVLFGGSTGAASVNDVWTLSLSGPPAWAQLFPAGTPPAPRAGHSALYDPNGDRMLAFGGSGSSVVEEWALSLVGAPPPPVDGVPPSVQLLSPNGGEWLLVGSTVDITWSATDNVGVTSVDINLLRQGPGPDAVWEPLVSHAPNTGSFSWQVTGPNAIDTAYVMVVARDSSGNFASSLSHAAFTIADQPAAAPPAQGITAFALSPLSPNPVRGRSLLTYAVPARTHVRLVLTDVQGREVAVLADGERDPGRYNAALDAGSLRAGMYFVRLQAKGVSLTRRVVVVK